MAGHHSTAAALVCVFALAPAIASGQTSAPKWEVEGHGGFAASTAPTGGDAAPLPVGAPYTAITGFPSRFESSWLFGDGAALINQVNTLLSPSTKITPLDPVIGSAAGSRGSGGSVGVRVTRRFGSRYSAEFNVDYTRTPLTFTEEALDGIEASRASFVSAFIGLFRSGPSQNPNVTATTTLTEGSRSELLTTGVFGVDLMTSGRLIPFVVGGGGVVHSGGDDPTAALLGNYAFPLGTVSRIDETDRVTIRLAKRDNAPVGVFGGGVRYAASPRGGIRGDVRFLVGGGTPDVLIDASPSGTAVTPGVALITPPTAGVSAVFSSARTIPSTLSGPAISGLRTFTASGSAIRTNIAGGVYLRF
jgi:hypothetical protein